MRKLIDHDGMMAISILPFAFYPIVKFGRMLRRLSRKSQESIGDLSIIIHETLGGARIVKAFGMVDYEKERFAGENQKFLHYKMKSVSVRAISSHIVELLGELGIVFIIWYGGYSVIAGVSTPGSFFSFMAALHLLYEPVKELSNINNTLKQGAAAAKAANAYDFIMKMPRGFESIVGERGTLLSGGERQRLCIARALLKNAPILILDEATSSLDSESELEVQKALENLMAERTTVVIAHGLSTIMHADLIAALADGGIVERGCHEDLLQKNGEYYPSLLSAILSDGTRMKPWAA